TTPPFTLRPAHHLAARSWAPVASPRQRTARGAVIPGSLRAMTENALLARFTSSSHQPLFVMCTYAISTLTRTLYTPRPQTPLYKQVLFIYTEDQYVSPTTVLWRWAPGESWGRCLCRAAAAGWVRHCR